VAAGRGSGGREYDIVPGKPDQSILVYRIASTDAGVMMPELGKRLVHEEGLRLIREWITAMPDPGRPAGAISARAIAENDRPRCTASSTTLGSAPEGAVDRDRFSSKPAALWRGRPGERSWWWQAEFAEPREVGAILQVHGDHEFALRNIPKTYVWQTSLDGKTWVDLKETATSDERRLFRVHRLSKPHRVRWLRLAIGSAEGESPSIREIEFYVDPRSEVKIPPWAVVVSTTGSQKVPGEGGVAFRDLARSCDGWNNLEFQNVWLGDFNDAFLAIEPRPLCAFLSGNFVDWCQQKREHWRGTAEILRKGDLPIWASCGGAQGLAILSETGVDRPWDCPQCRDPAHPLLPIYTHIAGSVRRKCGDYSACIFERGPQAIHRLTNDAVFQGLPEEFLAMESHCGQIEWPPKGWELIATCSPGGKTKTQCLRLKDHLIYAAQFHIEMAGTAESSRMIMGNFLQMAAQRSRGQ
jgi:hypothetical protein